MSHEMGHWTYAVFAIVSQLATVLPTVLPSHEPKFDMPMVNVTIKEKSTAILPCSVSSLGSYQVVWTDQFSTLLTFEERRIIDDERLSVERPYTRDWNLHIREVRYSDQGIYNCQINTTPIMIKTINLIVLVPSQIIDHTKSDIRVREGDTVTLVCNVTGTPQPTVTWYRLSNGGKGSDKQKVGVNGEVLIIHNVTRYCGDSYECVAFNNVPPVATKLIKVSVEFAPEIYLPNKRIGQEKGKETILECSVTAFPHAVTMWMKDGVKLTTSSKYRVELYDDERNKLTLSLRVFNINETDYGAYTCVAENELGSDEETMYLYDYAENSKTTTAVPTSTTLSFYIPHINGREESKHVYIKTTDFTGQDHQHFKPGAWRGEDDHDDRHPDYTPTSRPDYRDQGIVAGKRTRSLAFSPVAWPLFIGVHSLFSLGFSFLL